MKIIRSVSDVHTEYTKTEILTNIYIYTKSKHFLNSCSNSKHNLISTVDKRFCFFSLIFISMISCVVGMWLLGQIYGSKNKSLFFKLVIYSKLVSFNNFSIVVC